MENRLTVDVGISAIEEKSIAKDSRRQHSKTFGGAKYFALAMGQ